MLSGEKIGCVGMKEGCEEVFGEWKEIWKSAKGGAGRVVEMESCAKLGVRVLGCGDDEGNRSLEGQRRRRAVEDGDEGV